jgi:vitamin B12 transporter
MDANTTDIYGVSDEIVVTASRLPEAETDGASSVIIIDETSLDRLGEPAVMSLVRLTPTASVSTSGPAGSLTEVRLRGAEANHTLLFIDGIRANDPAAGNTPRFELLNADIASRIEVLRGPQSALWGSEAIGGVIAVTGVSPEGTHASATAEAGSFGFRRASGDASFGTDQGGIALAAGYQQSDGIDSFNGNGDRDGFSNLALRAFGAVAVTSSLRLSLGGFHFAGKSQYDGFDPVFFTRADTLDETRNRLSAVRLAADWNDAKAPWSAMLAATGLWSSNRNELDGDFLNRTRGKRHSLDGQVARRFATGDVNHALVVAGSAEWERFRADDVAFGGFVDQKRDRAHWALTGEYKVDWKGRLFADIAIRHDAFNRFRDATSLRASLLAKVAGPLAVAVSYGEGIAQPTFFDLYGFFPGSFVGNPALRPERSRGWEVAARLTGDRWNAALTYYRQRLTDEIVETFDGETFLSSAENAEGKSRRQGIEIQGSWRVSEAFRLSANYSWLAANHPAATSRLREVRRPRHSGAVMADGAIGKLSYGASIAYVGRRIDTDFDLFPAQRVTLDAYWLAGGRVAYDVTPSVQLFARIANAFDDKYQDVVGYRTEGRSGFVGLRLAYDRR